MNVFLRVLSFRRTDSRNRVIAVGLLLTAGVALSASIGFAAAPPTIVRVETGDTGDGFIDKMIVRFSLPMSTSSVPVASNGTSPGFFVQGYQISSFQWASPPATSLTINLVPHTTPLTGDTGATPVVKYISGGGAIGAVDQEDAQAYDAAAVDMAGPVLMTAEAIDRGTVNLFESAALGDRLYLTFSERATLAGATKLDRWNNLETTMQLTASPGPCNDGTAVGSSYNFPQPAGNATADDPILTPQPPSGSDVDYQQTFTVKIRPGNTPVQNSFKIPGAGTACYLGIASGTTATSKIVDEAGNMVVAQAAIPARRVYVTPADNVLLVARTHDGSGSAPDGRIDAVELNFEQNIDDASVDLSAFTITVNGQPAVINTSTLDSGTTADDAKIYVRFTPSNSWGTAAVANIAYSKPSTCTPTNADGMKANTLTPGFKACVASFNMAAVDGAGPALLSARTLDVDGNGKIDRVIGTFSEPIAQVKPNGWSADGVAATAATVAAAPNDHVARFSIPESTLPNTDATPTLAYVQQVSAANRTLDAAGAEVLGGSSKIATDTAAPRIVGSTVYDTDENGHIDRLVLEYSEAIGDPIGAIKSQFALDGLTSTGIADASPTDNDPDEANDRFLSLAFGAVTGTDAKDVAFTAGDVSIADALDNATDSQAIAKAAVLDKAKPVGTMDITPSAPLKAGQSTIAVTFSEGMATTAPTVTFSNGTLNKTVTPVAAAHTNGWSDADRKVWHGTVEILGSDCSVPTGCEVTATFNGGQDLATVANPQAAAITKPTEIDTIAPAAATLTGVTITTAAGESAPANMVNMFTTAIAVNATVVPADAEGGSAELLVGGNAITAKDITIGASDAEVAPGRNFDLAALTAAFGEAPGAHALTVNLCDDALNCTPSATSLEVNSDIQAIPVTLTTPVGGDVVRGGDDVLIDWPGVEGTDFDHIEIEYSTDNGESYPHVINPAFAERGGPVTWTTPAIDVTDVKVRVVTVDTNGNKAYGLMAESFAIDSSAPVVAVTAPASSNPFVPAGGDYTIRWSVTDASVNRATDPITIQYSSNLGSSWSTINGGDYSKANDGAEVWHVPTGASFTTLVRVIATDAVNLSGTGVSTKVARGVNGFTVERGGRVYAFGTASNTTSESRTSSSDFVRGIAVRSTGGAGYVLSSDGRLYPFSSGSFAKPSTPSSTRFSSDRARGLVLRTDSSGYVLSKEGKLYRFGGAPSVRLSKSWTSDDARAVVMRSDNLGGYVLDKYGRLHPFAVGSNSMPRSIQSSTLSSGGAARSVILRSNNTSGWILMSDGSIRGFGGAASPATTGRSSSANARSLVAVTSDGGYWMDGRGVMRAWGTAFGNPTRQTFSSGYGRGAAN